MKFPTRVPELGFYYHYKHDPQGPLNNYAYEAVGAGVHTEEDCRPEDANVMAYRPLYETSVFYTSGKLLAIRPLEMWMGDVVVNGETVPRFRKITDTAVIAALEGIKREMYGTFAF